MSEEMLSHLNEAGEARMVDVSSKPVTVRRAIAEASVTMSDELAEMFFSGGLPKGDGPAVARVAGIMAAKRTPELIPLCHPIPLNSVEISIERGGHGVLITATVTTSAQTGVEMEAMTAASITALTVYDMVKSVERGVTIDSVRLMEKSGGRSGEWKRPGVVE